ncbi:MAG TPA: HPr(Ser) kinase/phosphatase [Gammaproteobacteria bacterium]|nr:HPr(Ser) kinase/phosphatase [Gammaproteobacteria bacterium]
MTTTLKIKTLFNALQGKLGLGWISGRQHKQRQIHSSKDEASDVSLVGQMNLINPHRIQVLGSKELSYLENLKKNSRKDAIGQLFSGSSKLVIIDKQTVIPGDLVEAADSARIPLLGSQLTSQEIIQQIQYYLTSFFARKITLHGVFMEVMGTGVLITGDPSVGKSELALELLTRGHRLIADDATELSRVAPDTLNGNCPEMLQDFLEVRGLGILNVRAMFGASAIKQNRNLRLIIQLQDMEEAARVDRLHGSRRIRRIQDVEIPEITLPVGPGRNLAVLLEAAVRNHILYSKGYDASKAFIERQKLRLEKAHR